MGIQQKHQKTLTRLFKPITKDEHQNNLKHEFDLLEKVTQEKDTQYVLQKRPIGWLEIQNNSINTPKNKTRVKWRINKN